MRTPTLNILNFNTASRQQGPVTEQEDPERAFRRAMGDRGFIVPEDPIPDGNWHRFGEKNANWYVFSSEPYTGSFGSWKSGESFNWSLKSEASMDAGELARHRYVIDLQRQAQEEERQKVAAVAREKATKAWASATPLDKHPYLLAKQVPALGTRLYKGCVMIPVMDALGVVHSYETIGATGEKRFLTGGAKKGHFYVIPGEGKTAIVEGFSTGASVHVATGWTVVVTFDAGNMIPAAQNYREANPAAEMVFCCDNDHSKSNNTGRQVADSASKKMGVKAILPMGMAGTDWNDLFVEKGLQEVRKQLLSDSRPKVDIVQWSAARYRGVAAPEKRWLVQGTLPLGDAVILAAMGGAGKGMLTLDLALQVAGEPSESVWEYDMNEGPTAFGNRVMTHGPVIIFTAEDDNDEIHRRIESIGKDISDRLYILPLPDVCGPMPLVVPGRAGPELTPAWHELREQILDIKPVLVNFDPMASFVMADINADPAVGQFTMGLLAHLGKEAGASILVAHHLAKTSIRVDTPEAARGLVRGTTAIVDGARGAYVIWAVGDKEAVAVCKTLGVKYARNRVFKGCLVKNNFPGDESIKTFIRSDYGLLQVVDTALRAASANNFPLQLNILEAFLADQADAGKPLTARGSMGIWENKEILPAALRDVSKHALSGLVEELVSSQRIVKASAKGNSVKKWLCAPGSDFDQGDGEIVPGGFK